MSRHKRPLLFALAVGALCAILLAIALEALHSVNARHSDADTSTEARGREPPMLYWLVQLAPDQAANARAEIAGGVIRGPGVECAGYQTQAEVDRAVQVTRGLYTRDQIPQPRILTVRASNSVEAFRIGLRASGLSSKTQAGMAADVTGC